MARAMGNPIAPSSLRTRRPAAGEFGFPLRTHPLFPERANVELFRFYPRRCHPQLRSGAARRALASRSGPSRLRGRPRGANGSRVPWNSTAAGRGGLAQTNRQVAGPRPWSLPGTVDAGSWKASMGNAPRLPEKPWAAAQRLRTGAMKDLQCRGPGDDRTSGQPLRVTAEAVLRPEGHPPLPARASGAGSFVTGCGPRRSRPLFPATARWTRDRQQREDGPANWSALRRNRPVQVNSTSWLSPENSCGTILIERFRLRGRWLYVEDPQKRSATIRCIPSCQSFFSVGVGGQSRARCLPW